MIRLLKIELTKIVNSRTVWIIFGLHFLLLAPIAFGFKRILKNINMRVGDVDLAQAALEGFSVFNYPGIWHNMAYLAGWFKLFFAIIIVVLVTNEYTFRTIKQNIIDGMSKLEILLSKQLVIVLLSLVATLIIALLTLALGKNPSEVSIFSGAGYLLKYFFSLIVYLNFAYLLSSWLKKAGLTIGLLFLYTLVIENLLAFRLPENIANYLPMNLINSLIPNPMVAFFKPEDVAAVTNVGLVAAGLYWLIFALLVYWMLKRSRLG